MNSDKQDFEKYAQTRRMDGDLSPIFLDILRDNFKSKNSASKILDFGCGDGRYFDFFKKHFSKDNIYGVEVSEQRVNRCREIGWQNVSVIKKLEKLPFSDNFFDFINFDQVIEHIPQNEISFYLAEFRRILKPSGKIFVMTPNYPIKRVYDFITVIRHGKFEKIMDDPTHVAFFNFEKLRNKLEEYFTIMQIVPTGGSLFNMFRKNLFSHKIIAICSK